MSVIGTAGHVDHGKSALVKVLTGTDPDRWEEEKRRGLTIDLGFAFLRLASGVEVGIVDVPGHERFIKNMLAGAGAIGAVLFVVAADEGWKPQSQEHLDILDLLGVSRAIAVVTKADLVDEERLTEVRNDVEKKLSKTVLEGAPIHAVSSLSGDGLDPLVKEIASLVEGFAAEDFGRPRLFIDRVFTIKGSGTVVTGTLAGGRLREGDEVRIFPGSTRARIRGLQSHNQSVSEVAPGNRTAVNLAPITIRDTERGDFLSLIGDWVPTQRILASVRLLTDVKLSSRRGAFKFYTGAAERDVVIRPLGDGVALLELNRAVLADFKDRFILRDSGSRRTIGGGGIVDPHPRDLSGAADRARVEDRAELVESVLRERGHMLASKVSLLYGKPGREVGVTVGEFVWDRNALEKLIEQISKQVTSFHSQYPLRVGMPISEIPFEMKVALGAVIEDMERAGSLVRDSGVVRLPSFKTEVDDKESGDLLDEIHAAGGAPPPVADLRVRYGRDLVQALSRDGRLVEIGSFAFLGEWIEQTRALIASRLSDAGPFTVADFRDMTGTTRKYAVPLLEYFDSIGLTRREGDLRVRGSKG